jgi:thiamine biosynthesis protein ThiI
MLQIIVLPLVGGERKMIFPIVLARFGEIGLKSRNTRTALRRLLRHNVLAALKNSGLSFDRIEDTWDRLMIYTSMSTEIAETTSKVFGVVSASPAVECKAEINDISRTVSEMARESLRQGEKFAIRVRRVGKHEFTTYQIASACGSSVTENAKAAGIQVIVDLDSPDREFFVEVRDERCFVYDSVIRGAGGLPLDSQGRVVSILSDYRSIIATWLVMKRGCRPILVEFDTEEQTEELSNMARALLLPYALGELQIVLVPLTQVIRKIDSSSLRRCLEFLAMNYIALLEGAEAIVTSERTDPSAGDELETLREYSSVVDFPVFYPLVGLSEENLNSFAEAIGGRMLRPEKEEKVGTQSTRRDDICSPTACDIDSSLGEYREKIKEIVTAAVEESRL